VLTGRTDVTVTVAPSATLIGDPTITDPRRGPGPRGGPRRAQPVDKLARHRAGAIGCGRHARGIHAELDHRLRRPRDRQWIRACVNTIVGPSMAPTDTLPTPPTPSGRYSPASTPASSPPPPTCAPCPPPSPACSASASCASYGPSGASPQRAWHRPLFVRSDADPLADLATFRGVVPWETIIGATSNAQPTPADVTMTDHTVTAADGAQVRVRQCRESRFELVNQVHGRGPQPHLVA
jgi:hypothetical protein